MTTNAATLARETMSKAEAAWRLSDVGLGWDAPTAILVDAIEVLIAEMRRGYSAAECMERAQAIVSVYA